MIELRHLKHFVMLARLKHFNRAASKLNLAQPSLSRSIQKMEDILGVKLLERSSKSVSLTLYGELVLEHGEKIIADIDLLKQEIQSLQGLSSGELIIGASPIPSNSLLGPVIGRFIQAHPKVNVDLQVDGWYSLYQKLVKGQLSLFVAETRVTEMDKHNDLTIKQLPEYQAVFCVRPEHPILEVTNISLSDLRNYPLALPRTMPKSVSDLFGDLFDKSRHDYCSMVRFDQFQPLKESLAYCDLIAITPELAVKSEMSDKSLQIFTPIDMPDLKASFSVVYMKGRELPPSAHAFIDFLLQESD